MFRRLLSSKSKSPSPLPANAQGAASQSQGSRMNEPTQPMQNPVVIGLKPDGCLRAAIWTHEMANQQRIPCWTFVSDGLASLGQKEVVFTVCRRQGEAPQNYPSGPLQWFELLYSLAQQGQIANDDYSLTQFTAPDFLGRKDIGMVVYTRPQGLGGLPPNALPGQYLQAIPFTQDEASVATRFGTLRVLSQLGRSVNYFPYPPWIDRDRKTVISPNDLSESMVAKCATVIVSGVHAVKEGDDIRLYVRPRASQNLANSLTKLPPHMPFAILTELFADSDSCMVWSNGQREPSAIGTSLNRTSLCFLIICPQQASSSLKLTEDGYAFLLTDRDWARIHASIMSGQSLRLPTTGGRFHLEMMREAYHNPVDGQRYTASEGWMEYRPQNPRPAAPPEANNTHVQLGRVTLLTNPSPQECDAQALSAHVKTIEASLASILPPTNPIAGAWGKAMIVQLDISNGTVVNVQYWFNPNPDGVDIQMLQGVVASIPVPASVRSISFQMFFNVWGGSPAQPDGF